jgi:hypothetical protein
MELPIAAALYALGKLTTEEAISAAHAVLNGGAYSEALGEVILAEPQWSEVGPLFGRALAELGVNVSDRTAALWIIARDFARRIVAGELSPYEGARRIWWEVTNEPDADRSLLSFAGLASEWEDVPQYRPQYEADILQEARRLLGEEIGDEPDAGQVGGNS